MWPGPRPSSLPHPQALLAGAQQQPQQLPHALLTGAQQGWAVHLGNQQWTLPPPSLYSPAVAPPGWDASSLASNFQTMSLQQPPQSNWYFDSGATNHMTSDAGILTTPSPPPSSFPSNIVEGNRNLLPVTSTGVTTFTYHLHLNNVLVSPDLIKALFSWRNFLGNGTIALSLLFGN